jgi:uncharacterized protein (DUF433 family)/transposase-like protein
MATARKRDLYRGRDVLDLPAYSIAETARYLDIPTATLRYWVLGAPYRTQRGVRRAPPVIQIADSDEGALSFRNMVEAHVLDALRRQHHVSLPRVRAALDYLQEKFPSPHPLADPSLQTDGLDLFVVKYGKLINASRAGQTAMREMLAAHLKRIDRDAAGAPIRLYPFTRKHDLEEPRVVMMDPRVQYGRPVLVRSGIPTAVVAERYKAGESIQDLATDYGREPREIEEAIRCELHIATAA